jgi:hypothetical protein
MSRAWQSNGLASSSKCLPPVGSEMFSLADALSELNLYQERANSSRLTLTDLGRDGCVLRKFPSSLWRLQPCPERDWRLAYEMPTT